jgi:hypothetical protein
MAKVMRLKLVAVLTEGLDGDASAKIRCGGPPVTVLGQDAKGRALGFFIASRAHGKWWNEGGHNGDQLPL